MTDSQYCLPVALELSLRITVLSGEEHTGCCEGRGISGVSLDEAWQGPHRGWSGRLGDPLVVVVHPQPSCAP